MGRDFFRLVEMAIASGVLSIPGYAIAGDSPASESGVAHTTSKPAGPVVRSARLDKGGLTIQFSEALRAPAGVDPSKFRLTFAYYSKNRPGAYSYYYQYYGAGRPLTAYSDVGKSALRARIEQPTPAQIRIPASSALNLSSLCEEIATAPGTQARAGLYLHYVDSGSPRLESTRGVPVESIAPYWLAKEETTVTRGALAGKPIPVILTCP